MADFDHKAELVLHNAPAGRQDWLQDVYLLLQFITCLDIMVTWYFTSPEYAERERLTNLLHALGAKRAVDVMQQINQLAGNPEVVKQRFKIVDDRSEQLDDAWEEVTEELRRSLEPNLRQLIYDQHMRHREISNFQ